MANPAYEQEPWGGRGLTRGAAVIAADGNG
jgi:hypothetical protein